MLLTLTLVSGLSAVACDNVGLAEDVCGSTISEAVKCSHLLQKSSTSSTIERQDVLATPRHQVVDEELSVWKQVVTCFLDEVQRQRGLSNTRSISLIQTAASRYVVSSKFTDFVVECVYAGSIVIVGIVVVLVFWSRGIGAIASITLYLLSLSTMKLSVMYVYKAYGFDFPAFVTSLHFLMSAGAGFAVMYWRSIPKINSNPVPMVFPSTKEFLTIQLPISVSFACSIALNNSSMLYITSSFSEIIGSTTPIVSVAVILLSGMHFDLRLLAPTMCVVVGAMLAVTGNLNFSLLGTALCFCSVILRAVKGVMQQAVMTEYSNARFDPIALLAWTCTTSFVLMLCISLYHESRRITVEIRALQHPSALCISLVISCINATALNMSCLFVTKELGAVGTQLIGQTKSVLTVLGGMALFHDTLSRLEVLGFTSVLVGTFWYGMVQNRLKDEARMRHVEVGKADVLATAKLSQRQNMHTEAAAADAS